MNAIVCSAHGPVDTLKFMPRQPAPLAPGQVRIQVHAAGINLPDCLKVQGLYQVKTPTPYVPGSEVAGVVLEAAPEAGHLAVGDRVIGVLSAALESPAGRWS